MFNINRNIGKNSMRTRIEWLWILLLNNSNVRERKVRGGSELKSTYWQNFCYICIKKSSAISSYILYKLTQIQFIRDTWPCLIAQIWPHFINWFKSVCKKRKISLARKITRKQLGISMPISKGANPIENTIEAQAHSYRGNRELELPIPCKVWTRNPN